METITLPDGAQLPVPAPRNGGVYELYENRRLERLPLARQLDPRQFAICAITEANKLPPDTDARSIVIAVFNAACVGLLLGPHPGHAYLVAYRSRKQGGRECQLILGYKGYLELALDRYLESVYTDVVLRGEEFREYVDDRPRIQHDKAIDRELTWDNVAAAYCLWKPKGGASVPEVVGRKTLEALYRKAAGRGSSPWQTDTIAMCRKTPIRRAAKYWRQTQELGWAVHLDDAAERGEPQGLVNPAVEAEKDDSTPPLSQFTPEEDAGPAPWDDGAEATEDKQET